MSDSTGRSSGCSVRIVHGADEVRRTLLARSPDLVTIDESAVRAASRVFGETLTPVAFAERVIQEVRDEGDVAVRRIARALGDHIGPTFEIAPSELAEAGRQVDSGLRADIELAAERIREFHEREMPAGFDMPDLGVGQQWVPVDRAGLHVPGQAAPLVSSLLMAAVPARVAGVGEIVVTTPVRSDGIAPALAAAAEAAGVDRVLGLGGAQAIAALALGTQSVPRCDVVVAPGNAWVVLATRALYGVVGVDLLPGPTETLVIADAAADAAEVAADLIAQAEHGGPASPIALTTDPGLAADVAREVEAQLATLPRAEVAWDSFVRRGGVGVVDDLAQAVELSNAYAPEHLCLLVEDPEALLQLVRHAGGVFLGSASPEVLGDYVAGPSHIMPTGGTARFASPVGVRSFLKSVSVVRLSADRAAALAPVAARLARAEGLEGHARAAERRAGA